MMNFSESRDLPTVNPDNPQPSTSRDDNNILYNYLSQTSGQSGQAQVPVENAQEIIVVQADVHQANLSQCAVNPTSITTTMTRKSYAQRSREYKQRMKTMAEANAIVIQRPIAFPIINVSSNVSDIQVDPAQVLQTETMEIECDLPATSVVGQKSKSTHDLFIDVNEQDAFSAYRQHYRTRKELWILLWTNLQIVHLAMFVQYAIDYESKKI